MISENYSSGVTTIKYYCSNDLMSFLCELLKKHNKTARLQYTVSIVLILFGSKPVETRNTINYFH